MMAGDEPSRRENKMTSESAKIESRRPNIKCIGADTVSIEADVFFGWVERGSAQNAVVIRFRNGEIGSRTGRAGVNAVLTYKEGPTEIASMMGYWLETQCGDAYCEGDARLTLLTATVINGEFIVYEGQHRLRHNVRPPIAHVLKKFVTGTIVVRLTDLFSQCVVYDHEFTVTKNPLSIVPNPSA
jgi:hypothetical protein